MPPTTVLTLPDGRTVSLRALARELGVHRNTLIAWLRQYPLADILTRQAHPQPPTLYTLPDGRQVSETQWAHELGIHRATLRYWLRTASVAEVSGKRPRPYRSGGGRPPGDPAATAMDGASLAPEYALVAAVLRVAVSDARSTAQSQSEQRRIADARAWLRDRAAVQKWLDLGGLPDTTYDALLAAAGLTLPTAKAEGFPTVHHCTSRGPVQARAGSRRAPTPGARLQHLPTDKGFATPEGDTPLAGVDRETIACIPTPGLP